MKVTIIGGEISPEEEKAYIDRAIEKHGDNVASLTIKVDGDFVDLEYELKTKNPFNRLRRITGYLVGSLNRWNDAKQAEEKDRVKHGC